MPLAGAGHLEVHVAEVVLVALDVGEHDVVVALLDQAHRDPGHRPGDRHAGVEQGEGRAADRRHRRGAVALQRLGHEPQRVRELDVVRDHRQQGPLGERAVADVAALGAAHEAGLAHAEGREVVVVDVALGGLDAEAVDALGLLGGAEREAGQHLGLAAGEQAGAVHARQHADLARDRPDLVGRATVGALLVDRDALADDASSGARRRRGRRSRGPRGRGRRRGRPRRRPGAHRGDLVAAQQLGLLEGGLVEVLAGGLLDRLAAPSRPRPAARRPTWACRPPSAAPAGRRRGCGSPRGRSASASSIVSSSTSLAPASTIEMASAVPATTRSSSDSSVSCRVGLMMNSSPISPMRTAPTGPSNGSSEIISAGGRAVEGQDVERVDLVHRQDRRDDLGLVAVALGPQRPDRPVGHARGQGRPVARARLALDEAAGDLARGVHPLLDVHGEREEVRARAGRLRADRGDQHHACPPSGPGPRRWPAWPACRSRTRSANRRSARSRSLLPCHIPCLPRATRPGRL